MGNQLWIAESGGPLVYLSIGKISLESDDVITRCHFSHPDRYFVCTDNGRDALYVGRTAYQYSLVKIKLEDNVQLNDIFGVTSKYSLDDFNGMIVKKAIFTVGFSGNILMWYIFDNEELDIAFERSYRVCANISPSGAALSFTDFHGRTGLNKKHHSFCKMQWYNIRSGVKPKFPLPRIASKTAAYSMLAFDPLKFEPSRVPTEGPLTPFFIDSTSAILYEGELPTQTNEAEVDYIGVVNIGEKIQCPLTKESSCWKQC